SELAVGVPSDRGDELLGFGRQRYRETHGGRVRVRNGDLRRGCRRRDRPPPGSGKRKSAETGKADAAAGAARGRSPRARACRGNGRAALWIADARARLLEAVKGATSLAGELGRELRLQHTLSQFGICFALRL